ncbi:hypothetical protein DevBK_10725 [Devosia sp. BK]|uniref:hypothetical protein n=1 Tax=Devosia sp. BK TaxID=2871706 RepID=UPI00293AFD08|nr:hypothetical protein [Devosia sp. BK]MDV3251807.1 hypothetical protein [Devosia sp. BK]
MFFIIVPLETNPAHGTHRAHSILVMVKRQVLTNGHSGFPIVIEREFKRLSTGLKSVLVIPQNSTYVPRGFDRRRFSRHVMSRLSSVG